MTEQNKQSFFIVTYYLDDNDSLPCQEIMTAEQAAAMDDHKIAKIEEFIE